MLLLLYPSAADRDVADRDVVPADAFAVRVSASPRDAHRGAYASPPALEPDAWPDESTPTLELDPLALRVRECRSKRRGRRDRGEEEARVRHRDGDPWRVCAVRYRRFSLIRGSVGGAGVRWASIVVSWALGAAESSGGVDGVVVSTTKARWCR